MLTFLNLKYVININALLFFELELLSKKCVILLKNFKRLLSGEKPFNKVNVSYWRTFTLPVVPHS